MPLRLQAVASNKNIASLEFMAEFCDSVGAKILSIQCLLESEASRSNNIISAESAETKKILDKIGKKCNKMQIEFKNVNIVEGDVSTHYCFDPFYKPLGRHAFPLAIFNNKIKWIAYFPLGNRVP